MKTYMGYQINLFYFVDRVLLRILLVVHANRGENLYIAKQNNLKKYLPKSLKELLVVIVVFFLLIIEVEPPH